MARRRRAQKRVRIPDSKYESETVALLINCVMERGKKSTAQRIVYRALDDLNKDNKSGDPLEILNRAIENARPRVKVKPRRVGGATLQVPVELNPQEGLGLVLRWIVAEMKKMKQAAYMALMILIRDAAANQGALIRKKEDVHKMAQANRAFAHMRY